MSVGLTELLLLDTNIFVHWVRQDSTGQHLQTKYSLEKRIERPLYSTISEGEVHGLARCWKWGKQKVNVLDELLGELVRLEASLPEVVQAYAELYYENQKQGKNTGENDLWIAACAKATGAVLLTCDTDFRWLSPSLVKVEYVPETK